ncbi:MAG: methionine--tRNA ligase subunit beta, partial [Thermoguttaceae bacterium]|nr:methionine--tRNA ligase subunit beta [Thermoguttaceae bacterium]
SEEIAAAYEERDYGRALRHILECGYRANKFFEDAAPWTIRKELAALEADPAADPAARDAAFRRLQDVATISVNLFRQIIVYLTPILPDLTAQTEELLGSKIASWSDVNEPLLGKKIGVYKHMMTRVPKEGIEAMIEETKNLNKPADAAPAEQPAAPEEAAAPEVPVSDDQWKDSGQPLLDEPMSEMISIDDFLKVDLRVGRIVEAEQVAEARKLLKLKISLGGNETRQVFAGIKAAYPEPEKLVGRLVVFVANLQPRKMKFGLSEGMVVASGPGGPDVFLTFPDEGAKPGMRLH